MPPLPRVIVVNGRPKEIKELGEEGINDIPYIHTTIKGLQERKLFGFDTKPKMEEWLRKENLYSDYRISERIKKRARSRPIPLPLTEEERLSRLQRNFINRATNRIATVLQQSNIDPSNIRGFKKVLREYDPMEGPLATSSFLYQHRDFKGRWRYIPRGWSFPALSWIGMDNMTSSVVCVGSNLLLYSRTWFRGSNRYFWGGIGGESVKSLAGAPWHFNDKASSCISW